MKLFNSSSEKVTLIIPFKRLVNLSLIETINLYESEHLNQANEIKEELLSMLKEIGGTDKDKFASKCSNIINEVFYQISFSSQKREK